MNLRNLLNHLLILLGKTLTMFDSNHTPGWTKSTRGSSLRGR